MPEISRFFGVVIRMYYDDHSPPHFHCYYQNHGNSHQPISKRQLTRVTAADLDEICVRQRGATEAYMEIRRKERRGSRAQISPKVRAVTNHEAVYDINTGRNKRGLLPPKINRMVSDWSKQYRKELLKNWNLMKEESRFEKIPGAHK